MENFEKLEYLPKKSKFYSSVSDRHINDEDYEHVAKTWKVFKMKKYEGISLSRFVSKVRYFIGWCV